MYGLKNTTSKYLVWSLLALAAMFLARGLYIPAKAMLAQQLLSNAWKETQANEQPVKPWPWADTYPIARLCVPAHAVDQIVLAGDQGNSLAFGPGLHPDSDLDQASGMIVISAHRDTHFHFLKDIQKGEILALQTRDHQTTHYRVQAIEIVNGEHTKLQNPANSKWLVLVTCYPFNTIRANPSQRYVVLAEAISSNS
jgi:sortase A